MSTPLAAEACVSTPKLFRNFKKGLPLRSETKQVILNVYSKLRCKYPSESISSISEMCAELTGVSVTSVKAFKTEAKTYQGKPISPLRSQKTPARRRLCSEEKYDSLTLSAIKRKVHSDFFARNEHMTVEKVKAVLDEDDTMPNMCRETVRLVLKMCGFAYKARQRNSLLIDRDDIVQWRSRYLRSIKEYRRSGKNIVYLDETWVNAGHHKKKIWQDTTIRSAKQAFLEGLSTGSKTPSGKGGRLIVTYAGNEDGFVDGTLDIFEGKKTGDYHEEMDGDRFQFWFRTKLLPKIKPGSVIVMDNASYHSVKVEHIPTKSNTKAVMQNWLTEKNIQWDDKMKKKDLMALVEVEKPKYDTYVIDCIAENYGHVVLRLPPYHCEFNPIELAWAKVKDFVAKNNKAFTMTEIRRLLPEGLSLVTQQDWKGYVEHVKKEEEKMWKADGIIQQEIKSFVISTADDSEDSTDEDI